MKNHINDFFNSYDAFILTLPKVIPARPGGQNIVQYFDPPSPPDIFTPPQIIDDKVLFAFHIYLIRSIIKIVSMISGIVKMLLFWHYQNLSELDPGVKISYDILTPPL